MKTPVTLRGRAHAASGVIRPLATTGISVPLALEALAMNRWRVECRDKAGNLKWEDEFPNLVVNQGLDHLLDVTFKDATRFSTWFLALIEGPSPTIVAANTYASHAGWTEFTDYDEANRPTWTSGSVSGQSVSNSSDPATFTMSSGVASEDINGAALVSHNAKGDTAQSGAVLYGAGVFSNGNRVVSAEDVINVTVTLTTSAA